MPSKLFVRPHQVVIDSSGQPLADATYTFYISGTASTLAPIYADADLAAPLINPVTANSAGVFPSIWLDSSLMYRAVLHSASGDLLEDEDPYPAGSGVLTQDESNAGLTPSDIDANYEPGNVYRYKAKGDDLTNDSTAFANAIASNAKVIVPPGTFRIADVTITLDNIMIEGHGQTSILKVNSPNSRLFNVTGQNFQLSNTKWQGDGTTTNTTNGVGVYLNNAGGAIFEDNFSTGFGSGAISGQATTAFAGPKIIRHKCRLTGTGGNEFYLGGLWIGTLIQDPDCSSAAADRCLLMFDNSTTGWSGITVRGGGSQGYLKQQWATSDEGWDGSNRVWNALFDGVTCRQSNWSAIKCKTSRNVKIVNCTFDQCGLAQEDASSGLYGDVLCNSLGKVQIRGNTFRNSGSAAIRAVAPAVFQYPASDPSGKAIDEWLISDNFIDTTGVVFTGNGDGVVVLNAFKGALVTGNIMRGVTRYGVNAVQTALTPFWDLGLFNNVITDCPGSTTGINVAFGQTLRMDGNLIQNGGATGVLISDVDDVQIGGSDKVLDPAIGSGRGYQVGNCKVFNFRGRAGNSAFPAWVALTAYTLGTRVSNGANVYECVQAGTSGNTGGPIHTANASTEGTVIWFFVGKYLQMPYAVRLVGTHGSVFMDFDPQGCITGPIEGLSVGTAGIVIRYKTSVTTTNATPTNAQLVPLPDTSVWFIETSIAARQATGANHAAYKLFGLFKREGGATTPVGAVSGTTIESNAAWDATPKESANSVTPAQVTGAAAVTINWAIDCTIRGMT